MTKLRSHCSFAWLVGLVAAAALVVAAPVASAQTSSGGYTPPGSDVQAQIQDSPTNPSGGPTATPKAATTVQRSGSTGNSTLPFTGLDLGFIGLAGIGLLLVGFTLRRLTLREGQAGPRNVA